MESIWKLDILDKHNSYRAHPKTQFKSQLAELFMIVFITKSSIGHLNTKPKEANFKFWDRLIENLIIDQFIRDLHYSLSHSPN